MLGNLSIKAKLMSNSALLILLLLLSSGYAVYTMGEIGKELTSISEQDIPLTGILTEITIHQLEQAIQFERARYYAAIKENEPNADAHYQETVKLFDQYSNQIERELHEAEALTESASQEASHDIAKEFEMVNKSLKHIEENHKAYEIQVHRVFSSFSRGDLHDAVQLSEKVEKMEDSLDHELESLLMEVEEFTRASMLNAKEHEMSAVYKLSIISLLGVLVGIIVSVISSNFIVKAIRNAIVTASGDLTQAIKVESTDEVGQLLTAMNGMRTKLLDMISQISDSTTQLSSASEEMTVITHQTQNIIELQRSETEQVATAVNEMSSTAQEVANNIADTSSAAAEANEHTGNGRRVVEQSVEKINSLAKQIELTLTKIHELEQFSEDINSVMDVIKGIAEQTNLLALNAAIEAARAGEQGRGFAVVADEVRTLAGRTQESTEEINQMIEKLQNGSREAVKAMEESQKQANIAVEHASESDIALSVIAEAVTRIDQMSVQIASASEEQGAASEEISRNIVEINEMASQTANGAEETSRASTDLARISSELQVLVNKFVA